MKLRIAVGCAAAFAIALASIAYRDVQSAYVAEEFERAVANKDYAKVDAMVWTQRDIDLAKLSTVSTNLEIKLKFEAQSPLDRMIGKRKGKIFIDRPCGRSLEFYEIDFVASAGGIEITRNVCGRYDYPTPTETVAAWAADAGVTIVGLTKLALTGSP